MATAIRCLVNLLLVSALFIVSLSQNVFQSDLTIVSIFWGMPSLILVTAVRSRTVFLRPSGSEHSAQIFLSASKQPLFMKQLILTLTCMAWGHMLAAQECSQ